MHILKLKQWKCKNAIKLIMIYVGIYSFSGVVFSRDPACDIGRPNYQTINIPVISTNSIDAIGTVRVTATAGGDFAQYSMAHMPFYYTECLGNTMVAVIRNAYSRSCSKGLYCYE
ncbi:hypothetical protein [Kluyvera sichuanensis]|uniref:hypothetical protein n=1 Tax=Kluyvera sichuanensis TaxID=2725494 RepID=UPI0039F4CAC0